MANNQNQGFELQGYDAKIQINGVFFDVKTGKPKLKRSPARNDTTGTGAFEGNRANKVGFSFSGTAFRYSNMNPHASPFFIGVNEYVTFKYWGNAGDTATDTFAWTCTRFLITDYSEDFNAESGLTTIEFEGVTSGKFKMPGDVYSFPGNVTDP